jgi:hypothetical protein
MAVLSPLAFPVFLLLYIPIANTAFSFHLLMFAFTHFRRLSRLITENRISPHIVLHRYHVAAVFFKAVK